MPSAWLNTMTHTPRLLAAALTMGLLTFCGIARAQQTAPQLPVAELTRCDASFFNAIAAQAEPLKRIAPLKSRGSVATFDVPKPEGDGAPTLMFAKPVVVEGLEVVGFYDDSNGIPGVLDMHYWGFLVKASPSEVGRRFKPLIWEAERLRAAPEDSFVRSEIWLEKRAADGFRAARTQSGSAPRPGTVERVLLIEEREDKLTEFGCSLQGPKVPEALLRDIRPDLAR